MSWCLKNFGLQNSQKSAPKKGPENDAKKSKKGEFTRGPVLLPSVAAQRQHLKPQLKLAFGIRTYKASKAFQMVLTTAPLSQKPASAVA